MRTILLASVALLGFIAPATGQTIVDMGVNPRGFGLGAFDAFNPGPDFAHRYTFTLAGSSPDVETNAAGDIAVRLVALHSAGIIANFHASLIWEGADNEIGGGDDVLWAGPFFGPFIRRSVFVPAGDYHFLVEGSAAQPTHYVVSINATPGPVAGSGLLALLGFGALWRRFRRAA